MSHTQTENKGPYRSCGTSKDNEPFLYGVEGPGNGFGYHAWLGYPQNTFDSLEQAEKTARMMNIAFLEGKKERNRQIRELIE